MKITRKSILTGNENTWELPVTTEQLDAYYKHRHLFIDVFQELSDTQREFIRHGVTPQERTQVFGADRGEL